ncbi:hypothetical protein AWM68_17530 [Fictibacillus phosphorivorans]|uniref:Uncharacterized protein n=1 Tax=Fictibacillus phosphorivorans TaxID=1221500 RepID=A0A163S1S0_9BACL|nr:hypothetical protein [Fictibacillus phosphorivorans]KZE67974.1 hypothetical protein AWM68_17530 [Fictibacillus phosphorivorans]
MKKFFDKYPDLYIVLAIFVLFVIGFWSSYIFVFVSTPIGVINTNHLSDWVQWMGSFTGGVIGGILAYIGIKITLKNQRKEIQYENKRKALPYMNVKSGGEYDYKNKYIQLDFNFTKESKKRERKDIEDTARTAISIENVGMRELYDLYIGDIESTYFSADHEIYSVTPILYCNKPFVINLFFYEKGSYDSDEFPERYNTWGSDIVFKFYFRDCYDNWYRQKISISFQHKIIAEVEHEKRALEINYVKSEIKSIPEEISENDLPWKNGKSLCYL